MEAKHKLLIVGSLMALSVAGGYFLAPEKTKIVVQEKIVEKVITVVDKKVKTVIVEAADGTKTTTIDESSKTREKSETKTDKLKTETVSKGSEQTWLVSLQVGVSHGNFNPDVFTGTISRKIIGPIYVGGWVNQSLALGLALTIGF